MNNKTKTYILLAVVLGIWGTIGYKILNGLSPDESQIAAQEFNNTFKPNTINEVEVFSIQNTEKDPFLGTLVSTKKKKTKSVIKPKKQKPFKNSPIVTYGGLVKKQNTLEQVFVVNIENTQYLLKQGQSADSVRLVKGSTKEIVVSYKNTSQTIKRQ